MAEEVTTQVLGACVAFDERGALLIGAGSATWASVLAGTGEARLVADESVYLRLAVVLLDDPRYFVPHMVMDDFGQKHTGEAAFAWLAENTYSQPRADVFGTWAEGGADQIFARQVDAEARPVVLAYPPSPPYPPLPKLGERGEKKERLSPPPLPQLRERGLGGEGAAVRVVAAFVLRTGGADAFTASTDLGLPQPMAQALRGYDLNSARLDPADPAARRLLRQLVLAPPHP